MAIYLLEEERKFLIELLTEQKPTEEWWREGILRKILNDIKRVNNIKVCEHEFYNYTGKKIMCHKCGCLPETIFEIKGKSAYTLPPEPVEEKEVTLFDYLSSEGYPSRYLSGSPSVSGKRKTSINKPEDGTHSLDE